MALKMGFSEFEANAMAYSEEHASPSIRCRSATRELLRRGDCHHLFRRHLRRVRRPEPGGHGAVWRKVWGS